MSNEELHPLDSFQEVPEIKPKVFFNRNWLRLPTNLIPSIRDTIRNKFSQLTLSQWMYLFAFSLLMLQMGEDLQRGSELIWVGAIAGVGLIRELWHVFNRIWEHMLGKALILVLYAATANFALAISALKINVITGIEPGPFIFTLGFATLIMLPFWLLVSSILFFSAALIAINLWLVIGLLLRLVRVKVKVHWEDKVFIFITMIMRLILIPYVIMSIFFMAVPYAKQIELFDQPIALLKKASAENKAETKAPEDKLKIDVSGVVDDNINNDDKNITLRFMQRPISIAKDEVHTKWLDKLIAGFIYHFETYPKSACKKSPLQRSLPIDENLLLLVVEDNSILGYQFRVGPCEGNFTSVTAQPAHR